MNAAVLMVALILGASLLGVFVGLFMLACRLAGLPRPKLATAMAVVIATALVWFVVEAILLASLRKLYDVAGFPPWEVWLVGLFAGLPVSLAAGTILHVVMMRVSVGEAVQVWFIERGIRFSFVLFGVGAFAVMMLARK